MSGSSVKSRTNATPIIVESSAIRKILEILKEEARFSGVEVCVNREDTAAINVYEKVGFVDSGYIDENLPDCLNLIYHLQ